MPPARVLPVAVALALALVGTDASAAPSASERETARHLMDEGKARLRAGEPAAAIAAFQQADAIMHVPTTGLALARAHLAAGHLVAAHGAALAASTLPRDAGEPGVFEAARQQARELEGQLRPRIPTLRVKVKGAPARLTVDGGEVAPSGGGTDVLRLDPGRHVVVATSEGGGRARAEVELAERDAKEVELALPASSARRPDVAGASERATAGESPERTPLARGLVVGGFGMAALGLAAGAAAGALTLVRADRLAPLCAQDVCDPAARDDLSRARTYGAISTVGFAVAGIGLAAGALGLLLPPRSTVAWVGPSGIGGTF